MSALSLLIALEKIIKESHSLKDFFQKYEAGDKGEPFHINMHGRHGRTPLLQACAHGKIEIAGAFLGMGAKVNSYNNNGETPLQIAVEAGNLKLVRLLLKYGASPDKCAFDPLSIAVENGFEEIAFELLHSGSNPCQHSLLMDGKYSSNIPSASEIANRHGQLEFGRKLKIIEEEYLKKYPEKKIYIPLKERQEQMEQNEFRQIIDAGDAKELENLIEKGFILDTGLLRNLYEPFWISSAKKGHIELVKLFCKHNVDMSDDFDYMNERRFCNRAGIDPNDPNLKAVAVVMNENYDNQIKALKEYVDQLPRAISRSLFMFFLNKESSAGSYTQVPKPLLYSILDFAHEDVPGWERLVEKRNNNSN